MLLSGLISRLAGELDAFGNGEIQIEERNGKHIYLLAKDENGKTAYILTTKDPRLE